MSEGRKCEDCGDEAVFLHRYLTVDFWFCDRHSLRELRRDLSRYESRALVSDFIEAVMVHA